MIQLKHGYDFNTEIIGKWKSKASTAVAAGKVVNLSSGALEVATAFGYFLLQDVTTDGPSFNERELGVYQADVKAGSYVAVVAPKRGAIIWTDNMTGTAPAAGDEVEITTGGALQEKVSGTAVGKVLSIPSTGVFEIILY